MDDDDCKCGNRFCRYSNRNMATRIYEERLEEIKRKNLIKEQQKQQRIEEIRRDLDKDPDEAVAEVWFPENLQTSNPNK